MIDRSRRVYIPGVPSVSVYPDDRILGGFYALPDCPRVALDDQQRVQMRLILHGRQDSSRFQVPGGLVVVTLSLGLYANEQSALTAAIQEKLKPRSPGVPVSWLQMIWVKGRCDLWLTDKIHLTGEPSLYGDNSCVFQASLDEESARHLEQAWCEGLPDNYVRYNLTAQTPPFDLLFEGILNTVSQDLPLLITRV